MRDQAISIRLPDRLIQAIDQLTAGDGLNRQQTRSEVIRDLLAQGIRAGQRRGASR